MTQERRPIGSEEATDPREVLATLRPQAYGDSGPQKIRDPLIEPLWAGVRTLASVDDGGAVLVDADGDAVPGMAGIAEALSESLRADGVVLDGFLTKQTAHAASVIVWPDEMPSVGRLVGLRNNRAVDTLTLKEEALAA